MYVYDNFHYMDQEHRYLLSEFETLEAAEAGCRHVVNRCLEDTFKPGMSAGELTKLFCLFRDDPFIMDPSVRFSAREYATTQVERIVNQSK